MAKVSSIERQSGAYQRVDVDPITFEVIHHRLNSISDEQGATLSAISGSPLVNEATDYNTGIFRNDGEIVTMGKTVLLHAASVSEMIKHVVADCSDDPGINPGDMFLINHPYKGSLHAPDFGLVAPVFHDDARIGWIGVCCHQLDVGGMAPGGSFPEAVDVRQEGIMVPPVKVVENGKFRPDILSMITGMSRLPTNMNLDFRGMLAANKVALLRLEETIAQYGADTVLSVMDGSIDRTEAVIRDRLRRFPDGVFRAQTFLDHDGQTNRLYRIHVEVTKVDDRLILDFSKSADQAPRFMNCTPSGLLAGVRAALLPILAFDLPWNEGVFRPIEVVARPGSIVSAEFPAPVSQGPLGAMWLVETVATAALSRLAATTEEFLNEAQASPNGGPDLFGLFGTNQYGEPFHSALLDMIYVGGGAYAHRDGLSPQGHRHIPALRLQNVEANEQGAPVLYLYRKFLADTGGAGRSRGGNSLGIGYVLHDVDEMAFRTACHCYEAPTSFGLFGGYPSACNRRKFSRDAGARDMIDSGSFPFDTSEIGGEVLTLPAKMTGSIPFTAQDIYEAGPSAGAGWGDPLDRDPELVRLDVSAGRVSENMARSVYGVVIGEDGALDVTGTKDARAGIRELRLQWPVEKSLDPTAKGDGTTVALYGDKASYQQIGGEIYLRCGCGHAFAPAEESWKDYARQSTASAEQLGPRISLHDELEARLYACPSCARLLDVEIKLSDDEPLRDIELRG